MKGRVVAFGPFEWDGAASELRRKGVRVRLSGQPAEILTLLLAQPGDVVTREELRRRLWGEETFVDFEQGLNTAVARLRQALGDSADEPRYVETLPGRGYRFVGALRDRRPESPSLSHVDRRAWIASGLAAAAGAAVVHLVGRLSVPASEPRRGRFVVSAPPAVPLQLTPFSDVAVAPDGERVVYACNRGGSPGLYLRSIRKTEGRFLPGHDVFGAFFSPDGMEIGYYRFPDQALVRVSSLGGKASVIAAGIGVLEGASWSPRGDIVFGTRIPRGGLKRVPASGGEPEPVTVPAARESHEMPEVLPGGRCALFTILPGEPRSAPPRVGIADLETGAYRPLLQGSRPRYVESGHLVYVVEGRLLAVKFDADRGVPVGSPSTIIDGIATTPRGIGQYAFSRSGALVVAFEGSAESRALVWVDRNGNEEPIPLPSRGYSYPRISPDGSRVALNARDSRGNDIFLWNTSREGLTRMTPASYVSVYPTWSSDGKHIAFWSDQPPGPGLFWKPVEDASNGEVWAEASELRAPYFFSPSGNELVFARQSREGVQLCKTSRGDDPVVLLGRARNAALSPGGERIAYQSDEGGRFEVYVRGFPALDAGYHQVSSGGGIQPVWSPDSEELFFVEPGPPTRLMRVSVPVAPAAVPGRVHTVMDWPYFTGELGRTYDVSRPRGDRFLAIKAGPPSRPPRVEILLDGFAELKAALD